MVPQTGNGDEEALALWQWFRDESLVEFNRLYNELQVEFDSYNGEAFYNDKMDAVVDILAEKDFLLSQKGAQVVNLEKYGIEHPALIKNLMVQLSISHVTWLQPSTVKGIPICKSIYVVGQRAICPLQTTQGSTTRDGLRLEPRHCPCSVWIGNKRREKTLYS